MKRLHAHLQKDLDYDCLDTDPEEFLEELSDDCNNPNKRAAKRQRIERIATEYLRGRPPLIACAVLRGPFGNGWKNPWAKPSQEKKPVPVQKGRQNADRAGERAQTSTLSQRPSPEASRGMDTFLSSARPFNTQEFPVETPLRDAPADDSTATEFFSAEPPVTYDTSMTNPFWLRRHPSEDVDFAKSRIGYAGPSPTRIRDGKQPIDRNGGVQLAPPKLPIRSIASSPIPEHVDDAWRSSASASMIISSPVKTTPAQKTVQTLYKSNRAISNGPNSSRQRTVATLKVPTIGTHSTAQSQCAQGQPKLSITSPNVPDINMSPVSTFTPISAKARNSEAITVRSSIFSIPNENTPDLRSHHAVQEPYESPENRQQPTKEDVLQSAEKCGQAVPNSKAKRKRRTEKAPGHDRITSPALNASTGFMYRKIGETSSKSRAGPKTRPRAMTFDSSPAVVRAPDANATPAMHQQLTPIEDVSAGRDVYEVPPGSSDAVEPQESFKSTRTSFSTQAAMMLAHMEFQADTMPSATSETPRASLPSPDDTPELGEPPSVTYTPFAAFNAELDKQHPLDEHTPSQDLPPVNTQDLFAAASPFDFSTIKKKPPRPLGSSFRFSILPSSKQNRHVEIEDDTRSPTPSARIPPKGRNSMVSWSSTPGAQESCVDKPNNTTQDVQLPQLDFGNSLRDAEPSSGDLDFTDRFLHNLDELT
jgi:hypothetical protein